MAQITLNTQNEDGDAVTHSFHIEDDHAESEAEVLDQLARRAERVAKLRSRMNDMESELETARETIVSDIVRRKKLAGTLDEEDDIEEEREFLGGLPMERLKRHWDRAPSGSELDTDPATSGDDPTDNGPPKAVYGDAVA